MDVSTTISEERDAPTALSDSLDDPTELSYSDQIAVEHEKQRTKQPENDDDFDPSLEEFAKEDYDFKMRALMSSFSEDMKDIVVRYREQQAVEQAEEERKREAAKKARRSTKILSRAETLFRKEQQRLEEEALSKGVNMQLLRELKVAFEQKVTATGGAGVDEEEFLTLFGSSLCHGKSEEETRHWFRAIDQNCSGSIQWDEVSNYLVNYHVYAEKIKTKQFDYFVAKPIEPKGTVTTRRHHRLPIHKILYSAALDVFYTCSNDGCVMAWNPLSLKATHVVHRSSECLWVYDIAMIQSNNRLIVLQSDRCFFVYDCFMSQNELRYELLRVFATKGVTTKTFKDGTSYYECVDRKKVTGGAILTVDRSAITERVMPHMRPATLLHASNVPIRCFDHVSGLSSGIGSGEPIVCGLENGVLEFYVLQMVTTTPLASTMKIRSHTAMITQVKYAPELNGVISSSIDGTIVVTDIDIRQVVQRLIVNDQAMAKPQFGFEYKTYHNMLLSWTSRTLHVWNALTGARLTHLSDHESPIVAASVNVDRMIAFVLMESKAIRVWDVRNWRRIGEYYDETPRYCNDTLNFLLWSSRHHFLLAGCSELFALRPRDVQERIDAGLVPSNRKYVGHLHPIRDARPIDNADHIVAVDTHDVGVWGVQTKKLLAMWKWKDPDENVTCFAVAPDSVRIAIGTELGSLEMYNYACGFKIFSMLHEGKPNKHSVSAVLFVETSSNGGPPTCIASIGNTIHCWVTDRENEEDLHPASTYRHPNPDTIVWWLVCIDTRRQTLAASFNNGEVQIISGSSMLCNCSLAFHSPADRMLSFPHIPCLFAAAHADGTLRMYLYDSGMSNLYPLVGFHAAFANEETITCIAFHEDKIVVGDSVGTVSIFCLGPLLDREYVWQELIPNVSDAFFASKLREEVAPFVDLLAAFDAHESSVTSVSIVDGALVTSGGDRHLRNWNLSSYRLCAEYGAAPPPSTVGSDLASPDAFLSFLVTDEHHFHASHLSIAGEMEQQPLGRLSRTLSYAKRGSVLAEELRRVRLIKHDQQKRIASGLAEDDEPNEEEIVAQLRKEPSMLLHHRRRVSALVGDFVLRDHPASIKATTSQAHLSSDSTEQAHSMLVAPTLSFDGSSAVGVDQPQVDVEMRKGKGFKKHHHQNENNRRANALRPSRKALLWDIDETPTSTSASASPTPGLYQGTLSSRAMSLPPIGTNRSSSTVSSSSLASPLRIAVGSDDGECDDAQTPVHKRKVCMRYRTSLLSPTSLLGGSGGGASSMASLTPSNGAHRLSSVERKASFAHASKQLPSGGLIRGNTMLRAQPQPKPLQVSPQYEPPDEVQLFKLATDHVLKHQTTLVRTIPDKTVHSKLQEVMRIRQERQDAKDNEIATGNPNAGGVFFRLNLQAMENGGLGPSPVLQKPTAFELMMSSASAALEEVGQTSK